ncbi:MdtA/MuxA family multidrug efflux RND transporter periplasmic adaptor subunit [Paraburkholderia caballeronis]|uniref:Membrane fusion protein, multidrug efflux system n=1 Tax=Paraburkholderia caballeronis TaxID=416943 RepID=A0A1H7K5S3_9BURK|nr:MdtA/MuxA family multidrug efflux RND transporter periplasmic adaptor subunit [Paraburkholderia caballeronis]PXW27122.1 multidrug efflux system membrane fusion protein [Paraburkholderia caballeronis]PXX02596.1 multidrug efflux system membrane fusion protein [Paraburkholderia caballeronis]RAK03321.1 multidrug efflux system membrane fusion protein [Paraburkholderia caballeronis]SEC47806.1 membrane fusion protein, multidrug efflux system [Paraburkholderia caballeronis]SEK81856.1 membrane fusio
MDQQEKHPDSSQPPTPPGGPAPRRRRGRLIALAILIAVVAIVLLRWHPWNRTPAGAPGAQSASGASGAGGGRMRRGGAAAMANLAQPVSVATVSTGDMPIVITALGTVTPLAAVTVRTQLSGTLQDVYFKEGQMVKKGDVLAQIDPRPYEISLRNAQGQLARDEALLATARLDLKRYQTLLAQDSIASQQVDTQASLVQQYEGAVKSDQANVDTFKLDLIYARITAPVSGRVGLRQVDPGNYVTPGDTNGLVVLTQLEPISVIFTTSEDNLPSIMKQMRAGTKMSVAAYDRSNTTLLENGYLQTLDNQIDTTTGTVRLRASFDNPDQGLFPNQFVNARLLVDTIHGAVIVPTSAVLNGSQGQFVYVVKPDNTVTVRLIKVGPVDGERTSIASGLAAGERVVTDGSDRLREGAKITIPAERPRHASGAAGASNASDASGAAAASGAHRGHRRHASQAAAQ